MIKVCADKTLGIWQGYGGAFTEATAYNFSKLSNEKQTRLLDAYFGNGGTGYTWGRVSIGSNDFCLEPFEYIDPENPEEFSIEHDEKYVIPMIWKAQAYADLTLVASPWSPPSFMKNNKRLQDGGKLMRRYYRLFAEYLNRWVDEYARNEIRINYLTPQNEPMAKQIWESCKFSLRAQKKFTYKYLTRELDDTKILMWDHNKSKIAQVADKLLKRAPKDVAGLAFHWYDGTFEDELYEAHKKYPNHVLVSSEMCCGFSEYDAEEWKKDAALYANEILNDINSGASAWIDWNMLLDYSGGPTYCDNNVKSPIILNKRGDDFILTPIYKTVREIAQAIPAGSKIIRLENDYNDLAAAAKIDGNGIEVLVANLSPEEKDYVIEYNGRHFGGNIKGYGFTKIDL